MSHDDKDVWNRLRYGVPPLRLNVDGGLGRKSKLVKRYTLCSFRTGFNEVVFIMTGDDSKGEIYKLLLQNGAKEIHMTSGMFNL